MTALAGKSRELWKVPLGVVIGGVVASAALGDPSASRWGLVALLVSGAAWVLSVELVVRGGRAPESEAGRARASVVWVLLGWLGLRLPLLFGDPLFSDDVYRYVWEGRLCAEGIDPYATAPAAPELAAFRERWPEIAARVNHPEVPAAYPPLAELLFAGTASLSGRDAQPEKAVLAFRILFMACDLGITLLVLEGLRRRRQPLGRAIVWAWCPLVALESTGSAHLDVLALALLCAGLALHERSERGARPSRGAAALALVTAGALVKLLPALLLPFLLRRAKAVAGVLGMALVAAGVAAGLWLLVGTPAGVGRGLFEYAFRWESFNLVHRFVERLFERSWARDESWTDPRWLARSCALGAAALVFLCAWRARLEPARAARRLVAAFLILTPTLHPWYLTWMAPFLARSPSRAWAFLLAVAPLLYWPLADAPARGAWHEPPWLWGVVALPFFALLAGEVLRRRVAAEASA